MDNHFSYTSLTQNKLKVLKFKVLILMVCALPLPILLLTGCSQGEGSSNFKVNLYSGDTPNCSPATSIGFVTCIISIQITNSTSVPQQIQGSIYSVADGKVYKVDTSVGSNSIDTYSDTFNPNETKGSVLAFTVPAKSTITEIFVSNHGTTSPSNSVFDLKISIAAIDNASISEGNSTTSSSPDSKSSSNLLSRLNALRSTVWVEDPSNGLNTDVMHAYLGDTCSVWVFPDEQTAQSAVDAGTFSDLQSWIGTDGVTKYGIILSANTPEDSCAQIAVSVLNWSALS